MPIKSTCYFFKDAIWLVLLHYISTKLLVIMYTIIAGISFFLGDNQLAILSFFPIISPEVLVIIIISHSISSCLDDFSEESWPLQGEGQLSLWFLGASPCTSWRNVHEILRNFPEQSPNPQNNHHTNPYKNHQQKSLSM